MAREAEALSYPVRFRVIGRYIGLLCLLLMALTLLPLTVALVTGDQAIALRYGVVLVLLAGGGWLLWRLPAPRQLQTNEAMVLAGLAFLGTPLLMSYPLMGSGLSFIDALFEAISAGTTTGLSTLGTVEERPLSFLFARAWMQWYGGLGIVVLSLALVVRPGITAKCLAVTEEVANDLIGGTRAHARRVVLVYTLLTLGTIAPLWLAGSGLFNAVVYAFSAVSTGGFAPHDASLGHFSGWVVPGLISLACLAGSVPLALYHHSWRTGWSTFFRDLQVRALLLTCLAASIALVTCFHFGLRLSWPQSLFHAPLVAVSAQSTAGFSTIDLTRLDAASKGVLILVMATGGGLGSTAGGIKLLRLIILLRLLQLTLVRTCLPAHAVLSPRLGGKRLEGEEMRQALLLILLFVVVVLLSWLPFLALGYAPLDALFEVVSATGTVGLSVGVTGPTLPPLLKGVLCLDMLMGRLEILTWLVILFPRTWFGRRREDS